MRAAHDEPVSSSSFTLSLPTTDIFLAAAACWAEQGFGVFD
jgi:hypothetical protein